MLIIFDTIFLNRFQWVRVAKVPGDRDEAFVTGLEPNHQYKFRVTAINDEGDSEPLETEMAITAKNPYGMLLTILSARLRRHS